MGGWGTLTTACGWTCRGTEGCSSEHGLDTTITTYKGHPPVQLAAEGLVAERELVGGQQQWRGWGLEGEGPTVTHTTLGTKHATSYVIEQVFVNTCTTDHTHTTLGALYLVLMEAASVEGSPWEAERKGLQEVALGACGLWGHWLAPLLAAEPSGAGGYPLLDDRLACPPSGHLSTCPHPPAGLGNGHSLLDQELLAPQHAPQALLGVP